MGYRDYGVTLKTLNHYQSTNSNKIEFFDIDKPRNLYGIKSNNIRYYLHPYQEIVDYDKNYKKVFSSWFINQEQNASDYDNHGRAFYILEKQENLSCKTTPYPSVSDNLIAECLVCSNLTRYKIKSGWIREGYEHLLNEDLPTKEYYTTYDYSHTYRFQNSTYFLPAVRIVRSSSSRRDIICEQYKLKSLLMSVNEGKFDFLNKKIRIIGQNSGSIISYNEGYNFNKVELSPQAIVYDKNASIANKSYNSKIRSQNYEQSGWVQRVGYSLYDYYKTNPGIIENWVFRNEAGYEEGGYYYTPILDLNEDDTFNNYNIDEVQYYDESGFLVGYKLTGYLIDVKTLKISEEIICQPANN